MSEPRKKPVLSPNVRERLLRLAETRGERALVKALQLSPESYARSLAGLSIRRGTIAQIEQGLADLEKSGLGRNEEE